MKANKLVLFSVLLSLLLASPAFAALAKVGPIVPYDAAAHTGNGYPKYYMDTNGVAVDLPVPPFAAPGGVSPAMIFGPVEPANPFSVDIGFGAEAFFFFITPDRDTFDALFPNGAISTLNVLIGMEAGFAGLGATVNGQQAVFQRIRFNWAAVVDPGVYRYFHPYGEEILTVAPGDIGTGGLRYTIDTPIVPQDFTFALGTNPLAPGKIGPFLFQVNPPPQITVLVPPIPAPYNKPTDWLGDGATTATFTGSPLNPPFNKFRIEAYTDAAFSIPLNIFPVAIGGTPTVNFVETDLAVISAHRYHFPNLAGLEMLLLLDE